MCVISIHSVLFWDSGVQSNISTLLLLLIEVQGVKHAEIPCQKISKYDPCDKLTVQWPEANSLVILIRLVLRVASSTVSSVRQVPISYVSSHRLIQIHRCELLYLDVYFELWLIKIIYSSKYKSETVLHMSFFVYSYSMVQTSHMY